MVNTKKTSKTLKVLNHLQEYGSITSLEAINKYSATRLSSIIYCLRNYGYSIDTEYIDFVDMFGNASKYGKYIYRGECKKVKRC